MKWMKFTLETTTEAVDILSYELGNIGVEGIEIEDNLPYEGADRAKKYGEIMPEAKEDDGTAFIHFYMVPPCDTERILSQVNDIYQEISSYCNIGSGTVSAEETGDIDWVNNWKQYFKPFLATENIIIKPTWETFEKEKDSDILIEIDPGTAFGTGSHETTLLCIQALEKYVRVGMSILDVGCGSGILSITGIKLGAKSATAIDIDETAVAIARENLGVNQIDEKIIRLLTGDIITDKKVQEDIGFEGYDIIAANILPDILVPLTAIIRPHMKEGGLYITSGIIDSKEEEVRETLIKNKFKIIEVTRMKEWVSFVCR